MNGPYDGDWGYVVILTSTKRQGKHLTALAFDFVKAATAKDAIERAFPEGSPILSSRRVGRAVAVRMAEPRDQVAMPLEVHRPTWAQPERFKP